MRLRNVILLLGIVNAVLFSALLPLWEGFDEAFHYGYVETVSLLSSGAGNAIKRMTAGVKLRR